MYKFERFYWTYLSRTSFSITIAQNVNTVAVLSRDFDEYHRESTIVDSCLLKAFLYIR